MASSSTKSGFIEISSAQWAQANAIGVITSVLADGGLLIQTIATTILDTIRGRLESLYILSPHQRMILMW
jgi:hypothetical protein